MCFMYYLINDYDYESQNTELRNSFTLIKLWTTEAFCCDRGQCLQLENLKRNIL